MEAMAGRTQSDVLMDMFRRLQTGSVGGEHFCIVNATPDVKRHDKHEHQARSFSVGDTASREGLADDESRRAAAAAATSRRKLLTFTSITQFTNMMELYKGSVSTVYKAVEEATGMKVVVKAYHKAKMQAKHHHKLRREIDIATRMNGEYVAQTYGTMEDDKRVYIVMELCEGGDLFKRMMLLGGRLSEACVCLQIVAPLLRVLEKMHSLQLMHRDIKPENIFLTKAGELRLGDFGLALDQQQELPFSRSGTLDYMAPEVLRNPTAPFQEGRGVALEQLTVKSITPYTTQVDVWAVGILAYELVCGKPPFEVEDESQTTSLIIHCHKIKFPSGVSTAWADFVRHALIKDPQQRPTAAELLTHPWIQRHLRHPAAGQHGTRLLQPLPLQQQQQQCADRSPSHESLQAHPAVASAAHHVQPPYAVADKPVHQQTLQRQDAMSKRPDTDTACGPSSHAMTSAASTSPPPAMASASSPQSSITDSSAASEQGHGFSSGSNSVFSGSSGGSSSSGSALGGSAGAASNTAHPRGHGGPSSSTSGGGFAIANWFSGFTISAAAAAVVPSGSPSATAIPPAVSSPTGLLPRISALAKALASCPASRPAITQPDLVPPPCSARQTEPCVLPSPSVPPTVPPQPLSRSDPGCGSSHHNSPRTACGGDYDPLYQQFQVQQQQYMLQYARHQAALDAANGRQHRKPATSAASTDGATAAGVLATAAATAAPASKAVVLSRHAPPALSVVLPDCADRSMGPPSGGAGGMASAAAAAGGTAVDSPQPGPGTKERVKFYLQSQQAGALAK